MEYCLLIVNGDNFEPYAFLSNSSIHPDAVFVKGRIEPTRTRPSETSGFTVEIGSGDFDTQIANATAFLELHKSDFERLKNDATVETLYLQLSHACKLSSLPIQEEWIPPEFMRVVGELGIHVCLSHRMLILDESAGV